MTKARSNKNINKFNMYVKKKNQLPLEHSRMPSC